MKLLGVIVLGVVSFSLSSCEQQEITDASKLMMVISTDFRGMWADTSSDCSTAFIAITDTTISDSEIICSISNHEQNSQGTRTFLGINCFAEGHQLDDFSFMFKPNADETFKYKNSGESVWTTVKQCPIE